MRVFISGGCKNGKSIWAQKISFNQKPIDAPLYYVATMQSTDKEDDQRIVRHIEERKGWGFVTVEQATKISQLITNCELNGSFLLDSTTALLANEMFSPKGIDLTSVERVSAELISIINSFENIVIVSDFIYSDAISYDETTEAYRKGLATLDKVCASHCDMVLEIVSGNIIFHKGGSKCEKLFKCP